MRETIKKVTHEIDGKECSFQIKKMDALKASFLLKFVTEKLLPLLNGAKELFISHDENDTEEEVVQKRMDTIMTIIPQALSSISEAELRNFEIKCLQTVDMLMPAGWQPVMMGDKFGVEEVEYDPMVALMLCYDVVEFNFKGFFGEKGLGSLLPLRNSLPQEA